LGFHFALYLWAFAAIFPTYVGQAIWGRFSNLTSYFINLRYSGLDLTGRYR
jgi:hypothetical protein